MELQAEQFAQLEAARDWIKGHFGSRPNERYAELDEKIAVVCAILGDCQVGLQNTWELQALGTAFGDALAQKLMLEWVTVEDEYGRDPALSWPGTSLLCYPRTMISKRIEDGETVDARDLFELTCRRLTELAFSDRCA